MRESQRFYGSIKVERHVRDRRTMLVAVAPWHAARHMKAVADCFDLRDSN